MISEREKMLAGALYDAADPELAAMRARAGAWMVRYNASLALTDDARLEMLREIMAGAGEGCVIRPPFHCDYGAHIRLGARVFMNFNCVVLDVAPVTIGDGTLAGPGVQILTADHPRDPALRASGLESGRAIEIGRNVWIGGGALILPGVTVGDDAIIGAGAVVTRDIAPGACVTGNPARPRGNQGDIR
ncbi:MAG: sugar O-acetyltransferase [Paracoccus sp. (in: a-proteobacteria)]|nr:sugar O-acetyltransferase [Paracoccus sp. (in: a-proteobacteria)]